jgi:hypothetical protein
MNPLPDFGWVIINKAYRKKFVEMAVVCNISDNRFSRIGCSVYQCAFFRLEQPDSLNETPRQSDATKEKD